VGLEEECQSFQGENNQEDSISPQDQQNNIIRPHRKPSLEEEPKKAIKDKHLADFEGKNPPLFLFEQCIRAQCQSTPLHPPQKEGKTLNGEH
jgi:hypothetical protein